jgi:hypothetical protein
MNTEGLVETTEDIIKSSEDQSEIPDHKDLDENQKIDGNLNDELNSTEVEEELNEETESGEGSDNTFGVIQLKLSTFLHFSDLFSFMLNL